MTARHLAAVPEQPRRVVLYVRVSALMGRSGEEFHSPEVQIAAMRRVTGGMHVVDTVDDDIDQTGRVFEREGLDRIRRLVEAGAVDAMVVYNVARFGRNTLEGLQFLRWLNERNVTIVSATEHIDTSTPSGRWMLTTMLAMAEMRSDEIGSEWARIIANRARSGRPHGRVSTGYRRTATGQLEPDPALAPAVTAAFESYAADVQAAKVLRALRQATGMSWQTSTFKQMLANRTYLGHVTIEGAFGTAEQPGAHPPLVTEDVWEKVQARLARDSRMPSRLASPAHALSGIGRCGICQGATNHRRGHGHGRVEIFCRRQQQEDGRCTGCGMPQAAQVEAVVLERIRVHAAELKGDVGARSAQMARATRARVDAGTVAAELAKTQRAKGRLAEKWAREQIDDRTYEEAMASLRSTESALAVSLAELRAQSDLPEPGKVVELAEELLRMWPRMDGPQRNRALRALVTTVTIMPSARWRQPVGERVTVQWRYDVT